MEEVDVGSVLLLVLTNQQEDGGVTCLIQDRLTHLDCGKREVLQLFLQGRNRGKVRGETVEEEQEQDAI